MIPTQASDKILAQYVRNIVTAYRAATPAQLARGRQWYRVAHDLAEVIGDGDVRMGAGVLAALSANKRWSANVKLATDASNGRIHGHTADTLGKVRWMLAGANPEDILPMGLKTGNFYRSIVAPNDPDPVCIDRHAHDVAVGERYGNANRGLSNLRRYATLAHAYRVAARQLGELPSTVQAVTWCAQVDQNQES
jgi:hypothetical protein